MFAFMKIECTNVILFFYIIQLPSDNFFNNI